MNSDYKLEKRKFLFLIICLSFSSICTLKTLREVNVENIKIYGSNIFSREDLISNSSLNLPTRLIAIKTKYLEKELKQNLSLKNISINRQIFPFGLKVLIKTRTPIAHGEKIIGSKKISGFIDENGFFINEKYVNKDNVEKLVLEVFGWQSNFRKTLSIILKSQKIYDFELLKISFSPNGYLTLKEKDLNTLILGLNPNLIKSQLDIISTLKNEFRKNNFTKKIDKIDLTDPNSPKIKVFKP